ncbi:MAG: hypothetical protein GF393_03885, partial [Armatimonadia bacterium]|nr:hypothetical protein [Armatimonadia bacterium]
MTNASNLVVRRYALLPALMLLCVGLAVTGVCDGLDTVPTMADLAQTKDTEGRIVRLLG